MTLLRPNLGPRSLGAGWPLALVLGFAVALGLGSGPAAAQDLPPLPPAIAKAGVIKIGTRCDYPPNGFLDSTGKPQGLEVSLGRQIAVYAFGDGSKADFLCVTAADRIESLRGGKVDLVIAALDIDDKRKALVGFSDPYAWGGSEVLLPKDSSIKTLQDLSGKTLAVVAGAWQIPWFGQRMPGVTLLTFDSPDEALQAVLKGRADGYAHDYTLLAGLAAKNDKLKLLGELYRIGLKGAAVRKGETAWRAYVTAAIDRVKNDGLQRKWIAAFVDPGLQKAVTETWDLQKLPLR